MVTVSEEQYYEEIRSYLDREELFYSCSTCNVLAHMNVLASDNYSLHCVYDPDTEHAMVSVTMDDEVLFPVTIRSYSLDMESTTRSLSILHKDFEDIDIPEKRTHTVNYVDAPKIDLEPYHKNFPKVLEYTYPNYSSLGTEVGSTLEVRYRTRSGIEEVVGTAVRSSRDSTSDRSIKYFTSNRGIFEVYLLAASILTNKASLPYHEPSRSTYLYDSDFYIDKDDIIIHKGREAKNSDFEGHNYGIAKPQLTGGEFFTPVEPSIFSTAQLYDVVRQITQDCWGHVSPRIRTYSTAESVFLANRVNYKYVYITAYTELRPDDFFRYRADIIDHCTHRDNKFIYSTNYADIYNTRPVTAREEELMRLGYPPRHLFDEVLVTDKWDAFGTGLLIIARVYNSGSYDVLIKDTSRIHIGSDYNGIIAFDESSNRIICRTGYTSVHSCPLDEYMTKMHPVTNEFYGFTVSDINPYTPFPLYAGVPNVERPRKKLEFISYMTTFYIPIESAVLDVVCTLKNVYKCGINVVPEKIFNRYVEKAVVLGYDSSKNTFSKIGTVPLLYSAIYEYKGIIYMEQRQRFHLYKMPQHWLFGEPIENSFQIADRATLKPLPIPDPKTSNTIQYYDFHYELSYFANNGMALMQDNSGRLQVYRINPRNVNKLEVTSQNYRQLVDLTVGGSKCRVKTVNDEDVETFFEKPTRLLPSNYAEYVELFTEDIGCALGYEFYSDYCGRTGIHEFFIKDVVGYLISVVWRIDGTIVGYGLSHCISIAKYVNAEYVFNYLPMGDDTLASTWLGTELTMEAKFMFGYSITRSISLVDYATTS